MRLFIEAGLTLGKLSQDFMESVYSLSLEHSRASWSDTNTLIATCHSLGNLGIHVFMVWAIKVLVILRILQIL